MHKLRFRQIHLDFHTSPHIPDIGESFDKKQFQQALKDGHVNSITTFATCHHGWSYNETKVGKMHPNLKFDLLRAQFDAAKEIDVNVPIYITAGVNNRVADEHPEWRTIGYDGRYIGWTPNITDPGFKNLCFNSPYLDHLSELISETVELFPNADGIFLDIITQGQCCCKYCLERMEKHGYDPTKEEDRKKNAEEVLLKYYKRTTDAVKRVNKNMPIFHNSGHIARGKRDILKYFSHLELESLPTGGWGYDHFPISAKYVHKLDYEFLGMTGKFHTTWGEFGGFKHPNALKYECSAMLAYNAKCSIGDQLHPSGKMDKSTYDIIGQAYAEVEKKEEWCENAEGIADVAILSAQAMNKSSALDNATDTGAGRILLEGHILFDLIDDEMDFSEYKLLILPDEINVSKDLKNKIDSYLKSGGKLFITGESGIDKDSQKMLFDIGATYEGTSKFNPDYILPKEEYRSDFIKTPFVSYVKSQRIKVTDGESLGDIYDPYFNRTFKNFCSHQHTPYKPNPSGYACGVRKGNIMYLAHPMFTLYRGLGAVVQKEYVLKCINALLGSDNSLECNMPSSSRVTLNKQTDKNRLVLHLLYANTISRGGSLELSGGNVSQAGANLEVIEELMPLNDTTIKLKTNEIIKKVTLQPQNKNLDFEQKDGVVVLNIDSFVCHQMIVLDY